MKLLLLGPPRPQLETYLCNSGDSLHRTEEELREDSEVLVGTDFIIVYGYRYILRPWLLDRYQERIVNLHISLLPWNRGADPNLWSFLENTPKGVTVHFVDEGLDTGAVLAQCEVEHLPSDTLRSSYERLSATIEDLFVEIWPRLRAGEIAGTPQNPGGSVHRMKDKEPYTHLLRLGWDTPIVELLGRAKEA